MSRTPPTSLTSLVEADEGVIPYAYQDSRGFWSIGAGILIDRRRGGGLTLEECTTLLGGRLAKVQADCATRFPWYSRLDPVRQAVIASLEYNLGISGLLNFRLFLSYASSGNWPSASLELKNSAAYPQEPARFDRFCGMLQSGVWQ